MREPVRHLPCAATLQGRRSGTGLHWQPVPYPVDISHLATSTTPHNWINWGGLWPWALTQRAACSDLISVPWWEENKVPKPGCSRDSQGTLTVRDAGNGWDRKAHPRSFQTPGSRCVLGCFAEPGPLQKLPEKHVGKEGEGGGEEKRRKSFLPTYWNN